MIIIDKLCYVSKLRYLNANIKFTFAMLTLLICVVSRSIVISLIILAVNTFLTVGIGKIPFSYYRKLLFLPLLFLLCSTIAIIINISPIPLSLIAIPFFGNYITMSGDSCLFALQLVLTALSSVSCLYFLSLSTPMTDILNSMKKCHCPALLIELMMLIYRFIFILLDIASSLHIAQQSRLGNVNFKTSCKAIGSLLSVLLVRAFKKSNLLYDAMESRCYDGSIHVLQENYPIQIKHVIFMIVYLAVLTILAIFLRIK